MTACGGLCTLRKRDNRGKGPEEKTFFVHWCFLLYWAESCCQSSSHLLLLSLSSCTHPSALYQTFFHRASAVWFQNFAIRKVIKGYTQCLWACFRHGFVSSPWKRERESLLESHSGKGQCQQMFLWPDSLELLHLILNNFMAAAYCYVTTWIQVQQG